MKQITAILVLAILLIPISSLAHGGLPHVTGVVASVSATTIVVTTSAGDKSVPVTSHTLYYKGADQKHPAAAADVKAGLRVVVHLGADGNAAEVHIPLK